MKKLLIIKPPSDFNGSPQEVEIFFDAVKKIMKGIPFSLEINSMQRKIFFSARIEQKYSEMLEGQLYTIWPDLEILPVPEFLPKDCTNMAYGEMYLKEGDFFPFKTYGDFPSLPLSNVYSLMNKLQASEGIFMQLLVEPFSSDEFPFPFKRNFWLRLKNMGLNMRFIKRMTDEKYKADAMEKLIHQAEEKSKKRLYRTTLRILCLAATPEIAQSKLEQFGKLFVIFDNSISKLKFHVGPCTEEKRTSYTDLKFNNLLHLTAAEMATIFHLPRESDQIPNVFKVLSRKAQPPLDLPTFGNNPEENLSLFAETNFRDLREKFGITYRDRERHMYIIGKSGSGKSKLQELLIRSDILNGKGVGVIDPHGDLVDNVMAYIPESRVKDTILFDPADMMYPVAFNPLETVAPQYRIQVASGFIEIFKKLFGANWTPRLEHVLRFVVLALLDTEKATTMSILKLLTDRNFRQEVIPQIQDSVVKNFWTNEFASWSEKFDSEAIMPILNKIGQFLSNTQVRNIVCQQVNKFDMKKFMDEGKIVLMKLSKGILGEENSELIGSMIITKVQQAAMQRASQAEETRRPFYFYVDEFQNFATSTFGNILSEARKYKLSLTVGHQYIAQLSQDIRSTVFGNVGTIMSFRVGPEDAGTLAKEFAPVFSERDIVNLGVQEMYLKLSINGEIKDAFSARTLTVPPKPERQYQAEIIENTRTHYAQTKEQVEAEIAGKEEGALTLIKQLQEAEFEAPLI